MLDRRMVISSSLAVLTTTGCNGTPKPVFRTEPPDADLPSFSITAFDRRLQAVLDTHSTPEVLSTGYKWLEGPTWDRKRNKLYFTDVPRNIAYSWSRKDGVVEFLNPSGKTDEPDDPYQNGANGLLYEVETDSVILCNHGLRQVQRVDLTTLNRQTLTDRYEGHRYNSPNDVCKSTKGDFYFTDPPYGLSGQDDSPVKEMSHNGVYRLSPSGDVLLLVEDMTRPNGVILSPDERYLYITQSDANDPIMRRLTLSSEGAIKKDERWFDFSPYSDMRGHPDGIAVSEDGVIFVAGPGGVLVIATDGTALGHINTGRPTANCCFGEDSRTLFITAKNILLRLPTKVSGV